MLVTTLIKDFYSYSSSSDKLLEASLNRKIKINNFINNNSSTIVNYIVSSYFSFD